MIGPLVDVDDVCLAAETTLQTWLPSVLAEITAASSIALPNPATYEQLASDADSTAAEYPAVSVSSPGLSAAPERHGDGSYTLTWQLDVTVGIRGASYRATAQQIRKYVSAVRVTLAQHSALGGIAETTTFKTEAFAKAKPTAGRTFALGGASFDVRVPNAMNDMSGATTPPIPPDLNPDAPTATSTDITLETS